MTEWPYLVLPGGVVLNQAQAVAYCSCGNGVVQHAYDHPADTGGPYTTPAVDPAPWYDAGVPESAEFCGFRLDEVGGTSAPLSSRASTGAVAGGGIFGDWSAGPRSGTVRGTLLATTEAGLAYGIRWFVSALMNAGTGKATIRLTPPIGADNGRRDLWGWTVAQPPTFEQIAGGDGLMVDVSFPWIASNPALHRQELTAVLSAAAPSTGLAVADPAVTCPAPPFSLSCGDLTPLPVLPVGATFDAWGRPSCGPGSLAFENGIETIVRDAEGRPSSGAGSAHFLRKPGELPVPDFRGFSSCGADSAGYGASVASTPAELELYLDADPQELNAIWRTYAGESTWGLQPGCLSAGGTAVLTLLASGISAIRNVRIWIYAENEHANYRELAGSWTGRFDVPLTTASATVDLRNDVLPKVGGVPWYRKDCRYKVAVSVDYSSTEALNISNLQVILEAVSPVEAGIAVRPCVGPVVGPNAGVDRTIAGSCVSMSSAALAVAAGVPAGWSDRADGQYRWADADPWTVSPPAHALWQPTDAPNLTDVATAISATGDGASMHWSTSATGFAWATITPTFTGMCAGTDVRWVRMRARAWSPTPASSDDIPTAGNPTSAWTLRAVVAGVPLFGGGEFMSTEPWAGDERTWVFAVPYASLADLRVVASFAAQGGPGAVGGRIESLVIDAEWVGGAGCVDCGPNVADVPCAPSSPFGCWVEPTAVHTRAAQHAPGPTMDHAPVFVVVAGGAAAKQTRVRWWDGEVGHTHPAASAGEWDYWACRPREGTLEIPEIPAGWTLTVDCRARVVTMVNGAVTVDGSQLVSGPGGGAWTWPTFRNSTVVAVDTDDANPPASTAVLATRRELVGGWS